VQNETMGISNTIFSQCGGRGYSHDGGPGPQSRRRHQLSHAGVQLQNKTSPVERTKSLGGSGINLVHSAV
jgi:hypothetical protein